jgi:hypothetical protein
MTKPLLSKSFVAPCYSILLGFKKNHWSKTGIVLEQDWNSEQQARPSSRGLLKSIPLCPAMSIMLPDLLTMDPHSGPVWMGGHWMDSHLSYQPRPCRGMSFHQECVVEKTMYWESTMGSLLVPFILRHVKPTELSAIH